MQLRQVIRSVASKMNKTLLDGARHVSSFLYPSFCLFCDRLVGMQDVCCFKCKSLISIPATFNLRLSSTCNLKVYALADYRGPLRRTLTRKLQGDRHASWQLATLITQVSEFPIFKDIEFQQNSVLIPVPLHWTRIASRGFNQSSVMAAVYGQSTGISVENIVVRTRRTSYQSCLSKDGRLENVKGAFRLSSCILPDELAAGLANKHLVIVDDLCTTGATLVSVAKTLMPLNPASICAAVVCRVL